MAVRMGGRKKPKQSFVPEAIANGSGFEISHHVISPLEYHLAICVDQGGSTCMKAGVILPPALKNPTQIQTL